MSRVVVVGGGVAGLTAARELVRGGAEVTVLEAGRRFGGKLGAVDLDGVRLDSGAESMLARRPEAVDLARDLGLADRLVHPTPSTAQVYLDGRVVALPPSVLGVPRDLDALAGYLTPAGLDRARREPDLPAPPLTGDTAIGRYVDTRFGPEVTDRLLEPLLGGVYAGRARELSFAAVSPALFAAARTGGSLLGHASRLGVTTASGPVFAGLVGGVSTLVDALVADLGRRGATLRDRLPVRRLAKRPGGGYRLRCGDADHPEDIDADAVVLAAPAGPTGRLLEALGPVAGELAAVPYASVAVVSLAVRGAALAGSGLLVPPGQLPTVKALTYSGNKWGWVGEQASERWGPQTSAVRASVGRFGEAHLLQVPDAVLLQRTVAELGSLPGWAGAEVLQGRVTRWGGALPQYLVGHRALVDRLRVALADHPGLAVCGAALDGVGVPACVAGAKAAAAEVLAGLGGSSVPVATIGGRTAERTP